MLRRFAKGRADRPAGIGLADKATGLSGKAGTFLILLGAGHAATLLPSRAWAQPVADPLSAAFVRMMKQPGDADAALAYAKLAAADGQPRAAIAALERVLRINPKLDNIRLELASLYMSVGAADLAAIYANQALSSPNIPTDVAERARQLAAQAEAGSSRSLLQFGLFAGIRHDSDANQATSFNTVTAFAPGIGVVPITPSRRSQGDWSSVITAQFYHRFDLELQTEGAWETSGNLFDQRFFTINHRYDLTGLQADTGPRFGIGTVGGYTVTVRPFFSAAMLAYGDETYATFYGGGASAEARVDHVTLGLSAQGRFGNYDNSDFRPVTRPYTGPEATVTALATYVLRPSTTIGAVVSYYDASARMGEFSREGPNIGASVVQDFQFLHRVVELNARVSLQGLHYSQVDPMIDPSKHRTDAQLETGLSLTVPLTSRLAAVVQYTYFRNNSSYDIYTFGDNAVTLGVRARF